MMADKNRQDKSSRHRSQASLFNKMYTVYTFYFLLWLVGANTRGPSQYKDVVLPV